jgi:hypothetical protein
MTTIKCLGTTFEIHPAAALFPFMSRAELKELAADIEKHGLQELISRDKAGLVLDGRNRLEACHKAGVEPRFVEVVVDDPVAFVISRNIRRRHLSPYRKRELIGKLLKMKPDASDRQIAKQTNASPTTVGTVRKEQEAAGDVSKLDTRTDTKGRKQPAKKVVPITRITTTPTPLKTVPTTRVTTTPPTPTTIVDEPKLTESAKALREFTVACRTWLPKITDEADLQKARDLTATMTCPHRNEPGHDKHDKRVIERVTGSAEISEDERRAEMEKLAKAES